MHLRHLEYLRSVLAEGTFARAGLRHGVSQAAISLAMRSLEHQLGCVLFERQDRRKLPNERARALAQASHGLAESLRRLPETPLRGVDSPRERDPFKVGLAPAAGLLYGTDIHHALTKEAPGRLLSVVTGPSPALLEQLQHGELDLVIAPQPRRFALKHLERHVLYLGDPVIYARVGHPLQKARTLAEVADASWVVSGAAGTPSNVIEEAFRVRRWPPPRIAVQCTDYRMLVRFIARSDLLGVISNASLVSVEDRSVICPLSIREGLPYYDVCLFWPGARSRERNRVAEAVARSLKSRSAQTPSA